MSETERSRPHRSVERALDSLGINYLSEHPVDIYSLDVYMPEWHLAIEVDGPYHLKKHDKKRDKKLREEYGIETLRLNVAKKYWSQGRIKSAVMEFIEAYAWSTSERKMLSK